MKNSKYLVGLSLLLVSWVVMGCSSGGDSAKGGASTQAGDYAASPGKPGGGGTGKN